MKRDEQTNEDCSVAKPLNYTEKCYWVYKVGKNPHQKCIPRNMEISLASLDFQLSSIEKESSSLAQGQTHTVVASAISSR